MTKRKSYVRSVINYYSQLYSPNFVMQAVPKQHFKNAENDLNRFVEKANGLINELSENPFNYEALKALKLTLIEYKAFHCRLKSRAKRKKAKIKKQLIDIINKRPPNEIIDKIAKYELIQYNETVRQNPLKTAISPDRIIKNDSVAKKLTTETLSDAYKTLYVPEKIKLTIEQGLLENPKELYPMARTLKRHFVIHIGGTNTGKTYRALKALKKADTGAYLGPLRLLALEIQEELLADGIRCSMKTGEEENIVEGETHIASTVELADLFAFYDVAVIDECQMIADMYRGSAWTRAILGLRAENIHLCASPDALDILIKIIEDCGDSYEVKKYKRKTPLKYDSSIETENEISWKNETGKPKKPSCEDRLKKIDIKKLTYGDALIAFSRNDVLEIAEILKQNGIKASIIYGALPYEARKKQLESFIKKETTVVVATDAIGMGLNLPIKRVIFTSVYKFDGSTYRLLYPSEIKQIAGRAGRKGMYDEGLFCSVYKEDYVKKAIKAKLEPIEWAYIDFDASFAEIDYDLEYILNAWYEAEMPFDIYRKINLDRMIALNRKIEKLCQENKLMCDKDTAYRLSGIVFDEKDPFLMKLWMDYSVTYLKGIRTLPYPEIKTSSLEKLETGFKKTELYFSFCRSMHYECDTYWLDNMRKYLAEEINYKLKHKTHSDE